MGWYITRQQLKKALDIPASSTGRHALLDMVLDDVRDQFDKHTGFSFAPTSGTRFYTPDESDCLRVDYPLLAVDSIQVSSDGGSTYGTTFTTDSYYLTPYNATMASPPQPFWAIEVKENNATAVFPSGIQRAARITGTWGYFDQRITSTAVVASAAVTTGDLTILIAGATSLEVGHTILIDTERMLVTQTPASSTGVHTSSITVRRGVDGTVAAAHTSGATVQVYQYPTVEKAALYQAMQDYRAFDAPLGFAGGEPFGNTPVRPGGAGLHPFVARVLDRFRMPTAI